MTVYVNTAELPTVQDRALVDTDGDGKISQSEFENAIGPDADKTKVGYEIPFNRHFYVFTPPRALAEIDAELKTVTNRILALIGEITS